MERTVKKKKATDLCTLYFISIYLRETHYKELAHMIIGPVLC